MAEDISSTEVKCEENEVNNEYNPYLDFFSDKFDPLLALSIPEVTVPVTSAKKFDNLASYKSAMDKEKNPESFGKKTTSIVKEESEQIIRRWKEHQLPVPTTRSKRRVKNIFTKMEKIRGPLGVLKKCVEEKLRIKVYTRNDRAVRGYCLAYIVAFDKHFNMALEDVTEVWTRRKKLKSPALACVKQVKKTKFQRLFKPPEVKVYPHETNKTLENCSRHVDQLLMRGEHVVLVSVINEESTVKKEDVNVKSEIKAEDNEGSETTFKKDNEPIQKVLKTEEASCSR